MKQQDYKQLSKYLTTIQYPKSNNGIQRLVDNETIEEYRQRTNITRKKIMTVLRPFQMGQVFNESIEIMLGQIQDAIGVYNVPAIPNGRSHSWSRGPLQGTGWPRYLGSQDIEIEGGRIVVVLSDEGVKWLNGIAEKMRGYISEDVPTTNQVKERTEGEILDEEVAELVDQVVDYLNSDEYEPLWEY